MYIYSIGFFCLISLNVKMTIEKGEIIVRIMNLK